MVIIVFVFRSCSAMDENIHNDYGLKGLGESVLFGDKYIEKKYKDKK